MVTFQYSTETIKEMWKDVHSQPYHTKNNPCLKIDEVISSVQTESHNELWDTVAITPYTVCKRRMYRISWKPIYDKK